MSTATRCAARPIRAASPRPTFWRRLGAMFLVRRQRIHLSSLDESALNDIGVTPEEARAEARRPVWDVPQHWLK